ncbi:MAG TPA: hypothetical protein VMT53_24690 [Terriglobales bacterium]|nr:hypothetical protein [Terriglobales bacterium]
MLKPSLVSALLCLALAFAHAADLQVPAQVTAGNAFAIPASGSGDATLYLIGPSSVVKRTVKLGMEIKVAGDEVQSAGRYVAIVCNGDGCSSNSFSVVAADPAKVSFLLHPSRVPVTAVNAINATAFVFDKYYNPVVRPVTVDFHVVPKTGPAFTKSVKSVQGVAWMQMSPTPKEGAVKVVATVGAADEPRIIQQVASDACNLRMHARRTVKGVEVETDPVKDCRGNAVPDGTVISFTAVGAKGRTTVDAPIKKGIARAELPITGNATISVASGVVIGNEIRL